VGNQILEIAASALAAARQAMDVNAQNVANAQTPGYIRQRAVLAPVPLGDPQGRVGVGNGVMVAAVERLRNQCLEAQLNHQEGQLGEAEARADSLSRVQSAFSDLNGDGISEALGAFFDAIEEVQTAPASSAARDQVIFAADTFAQRMRETSAALVQEQQTVAQGLEQHVAEVNRLLGQVAELNARIMPLGDNPQAGDLKVTREQAIRELATLCGATGLDQPDGSQDVLLGGLRLVQGSHVTELALAADPADATRQIVTVGNVSEPDSLGGQIAGCLAARDQYDQWRQELDDLAATFAEACNTTHRAGYDLNSQSGGDMFTYDAAAPAGSLQVAATLEDHPEALALAGTLTGPPGDVTNAQNLLSLREGRLFAGGTQTAEETYREIVASVGREMQRATDARDARQQLVDALDTQYAAEAGVSLDEEAVEVMRLQQVYNAAIRLVKIADTMMQEVLGLAG